MMVVFRGFGLSRLQLARRRMQVVANRKRGKEARAVLS